MSTAKPTTVRVRTHCQGCKRTGTVKLGHHRPRWCTCPKSTGGPYVAPAGYVKAFVYVDAQPEAPANAADIRRKFFDAREAWRSGRWMSTGRRPPHVTVKERPKSDPKRVRLERRYDVAAKALDGLQARCPHPGPLRILSVYDDNDRTVEKHECRECLKWLDPKPGAWATKPGVTVQRVS